MNETTESFLRIEAIFNEAQDAPDHLRPGLIEFRPEPSAPKDLAAKLSEFLGNATGRRWIASVACGATYVVLALGASAATAFIQRSPPLLIEAVAGLAILGSLAAALPRHSTESASGCRRSSPS